MGQGVNFLDLVFFAVVAVFLVLRLRNVLGRRTGHQRRRNPFAAQQSVEQSDKGKVISLPDRASSAGEGEGVEATERPAAELEEAPVQVGFERIAAADRGFTPEEFLAGARGAFEIVVNAYAASDAGALQGLLSDEVFDNFNGVIQARAKAGHKLTTTLVGITSAAVVEAGMQERTAFVTVKFVSDQVNVTRDGEGNVVEGDAEKVVAVTDLWTFARNTRARDPNWTLVATRSPN